MKLFSRGGLAWLLLAVWAAWLYALQGLVVHLGGAGSLALGVPPGAWVPDLGLVLMLALAAELPASRVPLAALTVAAARAAVGIDPPVAVLAGYLGAASAYAALRRVVVESRRLRVLATGLASLALGAWLIAARAARLPDPPPPAELFPVGWYVPALFTALAAVFPGALLLRLPGLGGLLPSGRPAGPLPGRVGWNPARS